MPGGAESVPRPLAPDLARLLHDLRGPLNSLTLHLKLLESAVAGDRAAETALRTVHEQLGRLTDMLPAAFAVVALEACPFRSVDLGAVAAIAHEQAGGPVTLANTSWPTVAGDEALLATAVAHLLRNAVEATPAGRPWPMLSARVAGRETVVEVRDWGPGLGTVDPKLLIKLLHSTKPGQSTLPPFWTVSDGARRRRGVGLATVERIARLHQGSLRFETPAEGGALVLLVLPTPG